MISLMAVALAGRHHHFKAWLSIDKPSVSMDKHGSAQLSLKHGGAQSMYIDSAFRFSILVRHSEIRFRIQIQLEDLRPAA